MASVFIAALLLASQASSAAVSSSCQRTHGTCKQFKIQVSATAESSIYRYPRVDNDLQATAWAIRSDTWSTPMGGATIIQNTTTSGTFNIHAQLCIPKTPKNNQNILQIATHGAHYDSRYWDAEFHRENQSYVEAALKAGYSIFTYDRLGSGQSDIPEAYNIVQAPLELEILRQLTLLARNGTLYSLAEKAVPAVAVFNKLPKPSKIVHVGHSYGSILSSALVTKYNELSDGVIITGFILNSLFTASGMAGWVLKFAGSSPWHRPSGYVICRKEGIHDIFFNGNLETAFTQELLDYGDSLKQPVPLGELASVHKIIGLPGRDVKATGFNAPVQYMLAEFDFALCGGDCKGLPEADLRVLRNFWPNATDIEVAIQPNTGHGITLHNNATAGYQVTFDFLTKNGL